MKERLRKRSTEMFSFWVITLETLGKASEVAFNQKLIFFYYLICTLQFAQLDIC